VTWAELSLYRELKPGIVIGWLANLAEAEGREATPRRWLDRRGAGCPFPLLEEHGRSDMNNLAKALTALAALAFALAVVSHFTGPIGKTEAEGFSRACSNLALLAIALVVTFSARGVHAGGSATLP